MKDTPQQARLRAVCRYLLANGHKPTPSVLEMFEASFVTRRGKNITLSHGRLAQVRREEFIRAGWSFRRHGNAHEGHGSWVKP